MFISSIPADLLSAFFRTSYSPTNESFSNAEHHIADGL